MSEDQKRTTNTSKLIENVKKKVTITMSKHPKYRSFYCDISIEYLGVCRIGCKTDRKTVKDTINTYKYISLLTIVYNLYALVNPIKRSLFKILCISLCLGVFCTQASEFLLKNK